MAVPLRAPHQGGGGAGQRVEVDQPVGDELVHVAVEQLRRAGSAHLVPAEVLGRLVLGQGWGHGVIPLLSRASSASALRPRRSRTVASVVTDRLRSAWYPLLPGVWPTSRRSMRAARRAGASARTASRGS